MKLRLGATFFLLFFLAIRNGVAMEAPWFSQLATAFVVSLYWGSGFWLLKIYGIATESLSAKQLVRRVLEYGLPLAILYAAIRNGRGEYLDLVNAIAVWLLVGTSWQKYRDQLRPLALTHAKRFLRECGQDVDVGDRLANIWPLHAIVIAYVLLVALVPGLR
jgi:hypothetical protein